MVTTFAQRTMGTALHIIQRHGEERGKRRPRVTGLGACSCWCERCAASARRPCGSTLEGATLGSGTSTRCFDDLPASGVIIVNERARKRVECSKPYLSNKTISPIIVIVFVDYPAGTSPRPQLNHN